MHWIFRLLSAVVLAIPVIFVVGAARAPVPAGSKLLFAAGFVVLIAIWTWVVMRPSRFEISADALTLVFPTWSRTMLRSSITSVRLLDRNALKGELGRAIRVGVGGLFGTFGLLWTTKRGWVSVYVTAMDPWVFVEREGGRALLLSPSDPEAFVSAWSSVS